MCVQVYKHIKYKSQNTVQYLMSCTQPCKATYYSVNDTKIVDDNNKIKITGTVYTVLLSIHKQAITFSTHSQFNLLKLHILSIVPTLQMRMLSRGNIHFTFLLTFI